ncbi:DNA polymerase III subunit beta [Jiella avicenniae]|uniref:Beta sliding clamp n=1 Tax=Jiella avicenniae TaxID=2907202 RepID=A0A9X1T4W5_9HYPH|nr:DNA polymerase III subunit beta [Jiella avicenniae]MCE7028452.1 DNA polymerase III subunit beta [Jiella avicenniae]
MKLVTTANDLRAALATVKPAVTKWATIPILQTVLFDGAKVAATDLDMTIETKVAASEARGRACISFRPLAALCRHLPADEVITIEAKGTTATIRFSSGIYNLPSLPADDFSTMAGPEAEAKPLDGEAFAKALRFVAPFIYGEDIRYYLRGVCLSADRDENFGLFATDGHRLAFHPLEYPADWQGMIVPHYAVAALLKMPPVKTAAMRGAKARFDCGSVTLTTKLIDGTFPDWRRVVPAIEPGAPAISLDVAETSAALRRIGMARKDRGVPLTIAADRRGVVAQMGGEYSEAQAVERLTRARCDADATAVTSFNPAYLRDILGVHRGAETVRLWPSHDGPMIVQQGEADAFAVLMPMRGGDDARATAALEEWAPEAAPLREAAE